LIFKEHRDQFLNTKTQHIFEKKTSQKKNFKKYISEEEKRFSEKKYLRKNIYSKKLEDSRNEHPNGASTHPNTYDSDK
jgi:hypothetical protein